VHSVASHLLDRLARKLAAYGDEFWRGSGRAKLRTVGRQFVWTTAARLISAALQLVVVVLLARSLLPAEFAFAMAANAVLFLLVQLNGFGLMRQIDYRRSLHREDSTIGSLFTVKLRYAYLSGLAWALVCTALWLVTQDVRFLILVPAAIWLTVEQITQVWIGVAIVDGNSRLLIPCFVGRRLPVVLSLAAALVFGFDGLSSLIVGMVIGAFTSYALCWRSQEPWAQTLSPRMAADAPRVRGVVDIPFWLSELGDQIRDLDVPVLALVSSATAGIYALPARLVRPMNLITQAGGWVAFPHLVRRQKVSRRELFLFMLGGSAPVFAVSAIAFFAAPIVPFIAGADYAASVPVLQILSGAAFLSGPSTLLCIFLQARTGKALRAAGIIMLFGNLLLLACVFVAALGDGAVGASIGALVGQASIFLLLLVRGLVECGFTAPVPTGLHEASEGIEPQDTNSTAPSYLSKQRSRTPRIEH
jgi:O-antigen/teichoic acid export membrane protein